MNLNEIKNPFIQQLHILMAYSLRFDVAVVVQMNEIYKLQKVFRTILYPVLVAIKKVIENMHV